MDRLLLEGMVFFGRHGALPAERELGARLDVGAHRALLETTVQALGLHEEVRVTTRREERGHLSGVRVLVEWAEGTRRNVPELERMVASATLPEPVRARALDAIGRLARAESAVHGLPVADLHL